MSPAASPDIAIRSFDEFQDELKRLGYKVTHTNQSTRLSTKAGEEGGACDTTICEFSITVETAQICKVDEY